MYLANAAQGRDNNLNLFRVAAAMAVLVSHSFALATGDDAIEPMRRSLGMTAGTIAVDVFFIVSGFLVTGSLLKSRSAIDFLWGRVLRIYPGLWLMLMITVLGMGLAFTTWSKPAYLSSPVTHAYLVRCATLYSGIKYFLPGVFETTPYRGVNGSLWTLPYEIRMYAILLGVWVVLRVLRFAGDKQFKALVLVGAVSSGSYLVAGHFLGRPYANGPWLFFMFFTGSAYFVMRKWVYLSGAVCGVAIIAVVLAGLVSRSAFVTLYVLSLAYIVFYLAFIPAGAIRKYNRVGDYSYGIYVYAFPVQQSVALLWPGVGVWQMVGTASIGTLAFAMLSWHLVEHNALGMKGLFVDRTRRALGMIRSRLPLPKPS